MNKDIRINWNEGMELLPETFISLEKQIAEYRLMLRKVQASKQFGLIPEMPFNANVSLNGDNLTVTGLECHALLQHGDLVDLKRDDALNLPVSGDSDSLYLVVWPSDELKEYEAGDVPFVANEYKFAFLGVDELNGKMPIAKLVRINSAWTVQNNYILPVVSMSSSPVLLQTIDGLVKLARQITTHNKFGKIRYRDVMNLLVDEMECVDQSQNPKDMVVLCRRFARLLACGISGIPNGIAHYNPYDIQLFLSDIYALFNKAYEALVNLDLMEQKQLEKENEQAEECPIL